MCTHVTYRLFKSYPFPIHCIKTKFFRIFKTRTDQPLNRQLADWPPAPQRQDQGQCCQTWRFYAKSGAFLKDLALFFTKRFFFNFIIVSCRFFQTFLLLVKIIL
jgi:hypothetical protein